MTDSKDRESPREAARRVADDALAGRAPDVRREGETDSGQTPPGVSGVGQRRGGGAVLPGDAAGGAEPHLGIVADEVDNPTGPRNAADYVESKRKRIPPTEGEENAQR